jgi:hypothetical protein
MHRRLLIGELVDWYRSVLLLPVLLSVPLVGCSWWLMPHGMNKWLSLCWIGSTGLLVIIIILIETLRNNRKHIQNSTANLHAE